MTSAELVKKAVLNSGAYIEGHFIFANGNHSLNKIEMDKLWTSPADFDLVVDALGRAEGLPEADVILGVPSGGQKLADVIGRKIGLPVVKLERVPGGAKQDFRFVSEADKQLALGAKSPRIYEDVVSTLSSVAGVVRLLDPQKQDIHSLTIWRRGTVLDKYRTGVTDHYLVESELPSMAPQDCTNPGCND